MECPLCFCSTKVVDSRPDEDCVNRRRRCISCGYRFSTVEIDMDAYKKLMKGRTINA